jgi:GLPGLI family protein
MKRLLLLLILVAGLLNKAVAQYTLTGKIEYEKKMNVHALMKEWSDNDNDPWYERMKAQTPRFTITYFDMVFDSARAIYKPGREVDNPPNAYGSRPASDNTVLTDFNTQKVKAVKNVYEQKFMVQDSMRRLDWKIKDELRTIVNYKCRKAVAKILDSVYVVAFYTEDIPAGGGPEMFGGLPGMILELAIPRLHTTWVADKIEAIAPAEKDFVIPEKGKKVTEKELYDILQSSLKDWGKWGTKNIWWSLL